MVRETGGAVRWGGVMVREQGRAPDPEHAPGSLVPPAVRPRPNPQRAVVIGHRRETQDKSWPAHSLLVAKKQIAKYWK